MSETKIATANYIAESYYGLINGKEYILDFVREGIWKVYDTIQEKYVECRTDAFDNFRNYKKCNGNCMSCDCYELCQ